MVAMKNMKLGTKEVKRLLEAYEDPKDKRVWAVGFSGGKDSSVVLDLVIKTVESSKYRARKVYVLHSDTLLEVWDVQKLAESTLARLEVYAETNDLPIEVVRVTPSVEQRFFSLLLGKGYVVPRRDNRWCTDRLKVKPSNEAINKILKERGKFVSIVGVRKDESSDRKNRIEKKEMDGNHYIMPHEINGCGIIMPIKEWSEANVWEYLSYPSMSSVIDTSSLREIYALAMGDGGDECRTMLEGSAGENPGCSKSSRFGCIICPLAGKEDRMIGNLKSHFPYLAEVEKFRKEIMELQIGNWKSRDVVNHRDFKIKKYSRGGKRSLMVSPGGLSLETRKHLAQRLNLMLEVIESYDAEASKSLLSDEEIVFIQECWIKEGDLHWSAFNIFGKNLKNRIPRHLRIAVEKSKDLLEMLGEGLIPCFPNKVFSPRFAVQLAMELESKKLDHKTFALFLKGSCGWELCKKAEELLIEMDCFKMDFPSDKFEKVAKKEWEEDKISFFTFFDNIEQFEMPEKNLFGYDGEFGEYWDIAKDIENGNIEFENIDSRKVSLEEKMLFFDNF